LGGKTHLPLGLPIEPGLFTNDVLQAWGEKMKAANDDIKDSEKPAISAPPPLHSRRIQNGAFGKSNFLARKLASVKHH
jgi:hypothetical protein